MVGRAILMMHSTYQTFHVRFGLNGKEAFRPAAESRMENFD